MRQTLLMIDDSEILHDLVKVQLDEEDLIFRSAFTGSTGITMAASVRPDAILLDIDLPDMNGFDVCRFLKADPVTSQIPVIFLTASVSTDEKMCGMELHAADYVTKPFDHDELAIRVRGVLQKRRVLDLLSAASPAIGSHASHAQF